jgi:hypothetical protein
MRVVFLVLLLLSSCVSAPPPTRSDPGHLFVWASASTKAGSDFLAVVDLDPKSSTYAEIVATAPVPGPRGFAHHTEHQMPRGGILFANAFGSGKTYLFDLSQPRRPRIAASFGDAGEYMHPHSFVRLPNGNILATYQMRGHGNAQPGALAEISADGRVLRTSDAADPGGPRASFDRTAWRWSRLWTA